MKAGLPRKVMRVERNAMTADAQARIKSHESEGLCRRCFDYLPGIYSEVITKLRHFIHQPDVDRPISVLEKLGGFCDARARNSVDLFDDSLIERGGHVG